MSNPLPTKFSFTASRQKDGDSGQWSEASYSSMSKPKGYYYTAFRGDTKDFFRWSWKIADKITLTHQWDQDDYFVDRVQSPAGWLYESVHVVDQKNSVAMHIQSGLLLSKVY